MPSISILVTGGAGFIGSHLVERLLQLNHRVFVIDDLSHGQKENLPPQTDFFQIDIADQKKLATLIKKIQPQIVFHLVALVQVVGQSQKDIFRVNLEATKFLLSNLSQASKIIFTSSVAVYGNCQDLPIKETSDLKPISAYGQSKLEAEKIIQAAKNPLTILRLANVYGPRQDDSAEGGVVAIFMRQAINQAPLTIFGDGQQTRDFIFVDDVVDSFILAMDNQPPAPINISSNQSITINHLAKTIIKITQSTSTLSHLPHRPGDIIHSQVDNTQAKTSLAWQPQTPLKRGLGKYYASLKT